MNRLQRAVGFIVSQAPAPVTRDRFMRGYNVTLLDALVAKGYVAAQRDGTYTPTEAGARFMADNEAPING